MYGLVRRFGNKKLALAGGFAALSVASAMPGVNFEKINTVAKVKTVPGGEELPARSLWEKHGAVIQIVRRPG